MAVRFTIGSFPGSKELRDATGLPWGCTVQPFAQEEEGAAATLSPEALTKAEEVARCEECYAYISAFCNLDRFSWRCTLCDALNTFTDAQVRPASQAPRGCDTTLEELRLWRSGRVSLSLS